ncbi:MAG: hypothetical protein QOG68_1741, partial [Solirubrobacteraceae bacterium]|nr:hypothetical protein [Solirubrobacteraceae bacterium]
DGPEFNETGLPGPSSREDPRARPDDPAGTKPRVDPGSLLPVVRSPLISEHAPSLVAGSADPDLPAPVGRLDDSQHSPRFQFLLGALFALGLAGIAAVVALAIQGTPPQTPEAFWSAWKPTGTDPAGEIAQHVGQEYHLASGEQIVVVTGGPLEIAGLPMSIVQQQPASQGGNLFQVGGKGVLYRMCGLGTQCAIRKGKPSKERGLLLRREALELALYTFRYTDADNVVAFIPPPPGKKPSLAVFFRRANVEPQLQQPLNSTLTRTAPVPSAMIRSPDAASVYRITTPLQYQFSFSQANGDQAAFLVLKPAG